MHRVPINVKIGRTRNNFSFLDLKVKAPKGRVLISIGEVGLDYYWSREFVEEQLQAFEEQVRWAVELQLPLMIHCRKAQNEKSTQNSQAPLHIPFSSGYSFLSLYWNQFRITIPHILWTAGPGCLDNGFVLYLYS